MKYLVGFSRIFVGVLFIISGFIKLNDPLGFSFKLEEYFSESVLNITFLEPYALEISIFVVILEVLLGVMLLLGFRIKATLWSLLLMIVFFTFLTFYSAYFFYQRCDIVGFHRNTFYRSKIYKTNFWI